MTFNLGGGKKPPAYPVTKTWSDGIWGEEFDRVEFTEVFCKVDRSYESRRELNFDDPVPDESMSGLRKRWSR